jgi:colanic acid/amylovoran biosynthesis glycosyltransferase
MRLAVFTSWYPARITTFFERDMRALVDAGVEIDVFAIAPLDRSMWKHAMDLLSPKHLPRNRVHHLTIGDAVRGALPALGRHPLLCLRDLFRILPAAARKGRVVFAKTAYVFPKAWTWADQFADRYDHVLAYWGNYAATCAYAFHRLAEARTKRRIPFSLWLHAGIDLYAAPVFLKEKIEYADTIITCCEFNQRYIARAFPDPRITRKVHVCHHGLDLTRFPYPAEGRAERSRILAVGRLRKYKGFDYLVRAAGVLAERGRDFTLELVGDGDERRALTALAAELGIADRLHVRGWLSLPEVLQAMREATVLVHPSEGLGDGLPNVVREAMALGTPVIGSDVAGIPDALHDGCGVLVPPRDVPALADALEQLLADPDRRRQIAARARERAAERYDLWRNGARLASLLTQTRRAAPSSLSRPLTEPSPQC